MVNQALHIHLEVLSKLPPGFVFKLIVRYGVIIHSLLFNNCRQCVKMLFPAQN